MVKTIVCCDGCDKELGSVKQKYYLSLKTCTFLDGAGDTDYFEKDLVFCENCADNIKQSLIKISNR